LTGWAPVVESLELVPAAGGRFEVSLDDELIFSKAASRRHPEPGEIATLVRERIGPAPLG
jgi:selenoprotein W-related protein